MVISIANQKGGVGKTTTAVNLSASIAVSERKTLVIDMDSQCNASSGYGISYSNTRSNLYHVLIGERTIHEVIRKTALPGLTVRASLKGCLRVSGHALNRVSGTENSTSMY